MTQADSKKEDQSNDQPDDGSANDTEAETSQSEQATEVDDATLLAEAQDQIAELKDQHLRARADVENIRRRSQKEQSTARKFAIEGFATELVNVRDSLELAALVELEQDSDEVIEKMKQGLSLTLKQLDTIFEKFSIAQINPDAGDKLDPNLHQAMTSQPSDDYEPNSIVTVIQKGYQLHDRLLRPAMVIVATANNEK